MKTKKLTEISQIIAGYTFRGALKNESNWQNQVVLAKHINENNTINYLDLIKISHAPPRTTAFVEKNDVLLSSRGIFRAGIFEKDEENVIASSSMFILRIKNNNIMPKYLAIYLNSEIGQNSIQKILTGSTIKTILRRTLSNLEIPTPPLSMQEKIVAISENWGKRKKLLNQKIKLGKNIAEGTIQKLLTT